MNLVLRMLVVLVASLVLASSSPCTMPPLLKGNVVTLKYVVGDVTKPSVEKSSFAYDALGQTTVNNIVEDDGSSYTVLKYYRKKKQFIISKGSCTSKPLNEAFPFMLIPKPNHEVLLPNGPKVYTGSTSKGQFVISVKGKCLPMTWSEYTPLSGNKFQVHQRHFYDITGKLNFDVFKLPTSCAGPRFILPW